MPVTPFDVNQFMRTTDDGGALNFWDADFRNMHLQVSTQKIITVGAQYTHNLPGLAADFLGTRYLWWSILMYNGLSDPVKDIVPGVQLMIPNRVELLNFLQTSRSQAISSEQLGGSNLTTL